jgi:predicted SAM-dependent methyltransferase
MLEASKAMIRRKDKPKYQEYFTGKGVDIGCGDDCISKFKSDFPAMESCREYDLVHGDGERCQNLLDETFDFLHSSHCLEHLKDPVRGMKNWIRVVKNGGFLVITVPDETMYEKDVWPSRLNSQHYWSFRFNKENERSTSLEVVNFFSQFKDTVIVSVTRLEDGYYDTEEDLTKRTDISVECAIEIVLKKVSHTYKPLSRWVLNGFCFMLNSLAMGDVIAAAPVVKYMIENYYSQDGDSDRYMVVGKEMFRPIFWFVPDENWHNFEDKENNWGIPDGWILGCLNQKVEKGMRIARNTPKSMHLSQFAAFKVVDRALPEENLCYIPLPEVDISHFEFDVTNAVIIVSSYRDTTRLWKAAFVLHIAAWLKMQNFVPVFIGKTDMNLDTHLIPKTSLPADLSAIGIDLRNKTTIPELATLMKYSAAVIGLDSGPIHLAGTTSVPIVCGYTSVAPEHRIPIRKVGTTLAVVPDVRCKHCESNWASHLHNYEECYFGPDPQCCNEMTAEKFIKMLRNVLKPK